MIIGIGCDLVEHKVSRDFNWLNDKGLQERIFSANEIAIYNVKKQLKFLSGRFAAKEAVLKCLLTGMEDGISLTDIEILQTETGQPYLNLYGKALKLSNDRGITKWHVTITHSTTFSQSIVIAEG